MRSFIIGIALCASSAAAAVGQAGVSIAGQYSWWPEVNAIAVCGTNESYWIIASDSLQEMLTTAVERIGGAPVGEVFARLRGWFSTMPVDGFAAEYDALWRVTAIDEIRRTGENDCESVAPLEWRVDTSSECGQVNTLSLTKCATAELMAIDRRLQRYVTAAALEDNRYAEIHATEAAWERYRDLECDGYINSGGSWAALRFLSCRASMASDRLTAVWSRYFEGREAELPPP